jgi:hypothetical protein
MVKHSSHPNGPEISESPDMGRALTKWVNYYARIHTCIYTMGVGREGAGPARWSTTSAAEHSESPFGRSHPIRPALLDFLVDFGALGGGGRGALRLVSAPERRSRQP